MNIALGPPSIGRLGQIESARRVARAVAQPSPSRIYPKRRWLPESETRGRAKTSWPYKNSDVVSQFVSGPSYVDRARAVYDASAAQYVRFVGLEISPATEGPVDRSLLTAFVELVSSAGNGRVADIGCGPGRVAALLARHGFDVVGIDPSAALLDLARHAHPSIVFELGQLNALPVANGALVGAVCWYSIMYTPPSHMDELCFELSRAMAPGGWVLLAFPAGSGEALHRDDAFGTKLPLTTYLHDPNDVRERLTTSGMEIHVTTIREAELEHEMTPQAFIIARRTSDLGPLVSPTTPRLSG